MLETVVWIGVFIAVLTAILSSIIYFYRTSGYAIEQASATASAQRGIDTMVRIVREASYGSDGSYPIVSMSTSSIVFYADVDTDPAIEKVRFYVATTSFNFQTLNQGIVNPVGDPPAYTGAEATSTLSEYVHNIDQGISAFTYYDKNGAEITDLTKVADLRFLTLTVVVDVNPIKSPTLLTFRSSAALRNIR